MDVIATELMDDILIIRLNRPETMNAFNTEMVDSLKEAIKFSRDDSRVRSVIITGNGNSFSAGVDLKMFIDWNRTKQEEFELVTKKFHQIILEIRRLKKPVIAAINGISYGVGFSLAMSCDLRIASDEAKFKQAYTSIGLVPDGGWTLSVARHIGMARTCELLLLDPVVEADEMLRLGLINRVVKREELEVSSIQIAKEASSKPPAAFASAKELVNKSIYFGLDEQLEAEIRAIINATATAEFKESVMAFLKRRNEKA